MPRWVTLLVSAVALLGGCNEAEHRLLVDLRTDVVPGVEADMVEVVLDEGEGAMVPFDEASDYFLGARVAEWEALASGRHRVTVRLYDEDNAVLERTIAVDLSTDRVVTAVLTRDCRGVECPGDGAATATACLNGQCVDPECSPETPELCPAESRCAASADCGGAAGCGEGRCEAGACLYAPVLECSAGQRCDPLDGCRSDSSGSGDWQLQANDDTVFVIFDVEGEARIDGQVVTPNGLTDLFIQAREPDGVTVRWTRQFGTTNWEWPAAAAIDPMQRLVVGGVIKDADVFAEWGVTIEGQDGSHNSAVVVFEPDAGDPIWAMGVQADTDTDITAIAAGPDGWLYAAVVSAADITVGGLTGTATGAVTHFLVAFEPAVPGPGWTAAWVAVVPEDDAQITALAADNDALYVGGTIGSSLTLFGETATTTIGTGLVSRVEGVSATPTLAWHEVLGGDVSVEVRALELDPASGVAVGGVVGEGTASFGTIEVTSAGSLDGFVAGFGPDRSPLYALLIGGPNDDGVADIEYDIGSATMVVTGEVGQDVDLGGNDIGAGDRWQTAFVARLDAAGAVRAANRVPAGSATGSWSGSSVATTSSGLDCVLGTAPWDAEPIFFRGTWQRRFLECR